jgi:hypothetical protein
MRYIFEPSALKTPARQSPAFAPIGLLNDVEEYPTAVVMPFGAAAPAGAAALRPAAASRTMIATSTWTARRTVNVMDLPHSDGEDLAKSSESIEKVVAQRDGHIEG